MEGNIPSGNMMQGAASYSVLDLQTSMQIPHHHHHHHQQNATNPNPNFSHPGLSAAGFSHQLTQIPESSDQHSGIPFMDYGKHGSAMDHSKTPVSDEDEAVDPTDEGTGPGHSSDKGGKKGAGTPWQRMKWTDAMVKLLITAVSYTGEDTGSDCTGGTRRKFTVLQKKGKWKAISKVMGERGCYVSPQQCEDKFNDLNKRYKRLTDILGRGTSCKVVENPTLLEQMDLSDKVKDDVRKILSSKHLFYEEMCSYHNGNRINLPADPALQKALLLALRNREETDLTKRGFSGEGDEEEHSINSEDEEDDMHGTDLHAYSHKRMREDNACCGNSSYGNSGGHGGRLDINQALIEGGSNCGNMSCGGSAEQVLELEKNKLQLQEQSLELERQRFKWERFSKKKDRELQRMKMQNERMRLENERMALELKHKELELDLQMKRGSL